MDRILRDIMRFFDINSTYKPFSRKTIVLGGDFCHILPIISRASREDIIFTIVNLSKLWSHCKGLTLTKNMRLQPTNSSSVDPMLKVFADWIIMLGGRNLGLDNDRNWNSK